MRRTATLVAAFALVACASSLRAGDFPSSPLIPDTALNIAPGYTIPLDKLVYWGGVVAIAYFVTDPLAPNWEIREAEFPEQQYRLRLKMKRYYAGGAGEARQVFNRRAADLARKGGHAGYQIIDYSEGLESNVIGSQRVAEGTIALIPFTQGEAAPARITVPSAEKPRS